MGSQRSWRGKEQEERRRNRLDSEAGGRDKMGNKLKSVTPKQGKRVHLVAKSSGGGLCLAKEWNPEKWLLHNESLVNSCRTNVFVM